jgi:hypothetical protein
VEGNDNAYPHLLKKVNTRRRPIDKTHLLTSRIVKGNGMWLNAAVVKNKVAMQVFGELHGS